MNTKKMLKRVNRGVILGAVVIIVLVIYIITDTIRFNGSKDDIKKECESYIADVSAAIISDNDGVWTDENREDKISQIQEVIDNHWVDSSITSLESDYNDDKLDMKNYVKNSYSDMAYAGNVTKASMKLTGVTVKKYGPGGAVLSGTVETTMSIPAYESFFCINGLTEYSQFSWESEDSAKEDGKVKSAMVDTQVSYDVNYYLKYTDGKWKICSQACYSNMSSSSSEFYDEKTYDSSKKNVTEDADKSEQTDVSGKGGKDGDRA